MGVAPVAPLHHLAPPAPGEASQGVSTHGALHRWRLETWRPVAAGWTIGRVWMVSPCGNKLGVEDVEDVEVMKRMEVWILKRDLALRNGCLNPQESGLSHQKVRQHFASAWHLRLFRIAYHYQMLKCPMTEGHVAYQLRQLLSAAMYCHQRTLVLQMLQGWGWKFGLGLLGM